MGWSKYTLYLDIGTIYGRLTILQVDEASKQTEDGVLTPAFWKYITKCECGTIKSIYRKHIVTGDSSSCGCYRTERSVAACTKVNSINITSLGTIIYFYNSNRYTIIDTEDYEKVKPYCWGLSSTGYAYASAKEGNKKIKLHRLLLNFPKKGVIDHINGDSLDNRKINLRVCTTQQNTQNSKRKRNSKLSHTGVYFNTLINKWEASITVNYKTIKLGAFYSKLEAIEKRHLAELKYFKEFAPSLRPNKEIY